MIIAKIVEFHSAHHLLHYDGKCSNMHGHTWKAIFKFHVNNPLNQSGISVDFSVLKKILNDIVPDHMIVNDWLASLQVKHPQLGSKILSPSAEIIAIALALEVIYTTTTLGVDFHSIKVYETDTSFVEVDRHDIGAEAISRAVRPELD